MSHLTDAHYTGAAAAYSHDRYFLHTDSSSQLRSYVHRSHARAFVRKMRGGAQAHLLEASDGHYYVVKFRNNPQHRRILVNEWLAARIFSQLGIQTPATAIIELTPEFLDANPEVYIQLGSKRIPVEPGWHFGSRFPGHPDRLAVYDFLPDQLLSSVHNRPDFLACFAADKWLGNSDGRQAIFFRAQLKEWTSSGDHPLRKAFLAQMIDHGFILNGPYWDFPDSPMHGLYFRNTVYESITSLDSFEPWLSQIRSFPVEVLDEAVRGLPPAWIDCDTTELDRLIETLLKRRKKVADWISDTRKSRVNPFPGWKHSSSKSQSRIVRGRSKSIPMSEQTETVLGDTQLLSPRKDAEGSAI